MSSMANVCWSCLSHLWSLWCCCLPMQVELINRLERERSCLVLSLNQVGGTGRSLSSGSSPGARPSSSLGYSDGDYSHRRWPPGWGRKGSASEFGGRQVRPGHSWFQIQIDHAVAMRRATVTKRTPWCCVLFLKENQLNPLAPLLDERRTPLTTPQSKIKSTSHT